MTIGAAKTYIATIERKTDLGYSIRVEDESLLLHRNDCAEKYEVNDEVTIFTYVDHEGRITATTYEPFITTEEYGFVKVVDVHPKLGVFVDVGLKKDMLVPHEELPWITSQWPIVDDVLYCRLKVTNRDRIIAVTQGITGFEDMARPASEEDNNKNIQARVIKTTKIGTYVYTTEEYFGFIHESERIEEPRMGELISGRIIDIKPDGTVNISLRPRKQEAQADDASHIFEYLQGRGGRMPYGDKTPPDVIENLFDMSKGAFKRALGKLMKERKIIQKDGWTEIVVVESTEE